MTSHSSDPPPSGAGAPGGAAPPLDPATVDPDPFAQFQRWWAEVPYDPGSPEAAAMTLATVGQDGAPSARMVLLRQADARGFTFHTHYESRKARELEAEPRAALVLWWPARERQVRIEGVVERLPDAESDAYFASRAPGHRVSAWASPQSWPLGSRDELERRVADARRAHGAAPAHRPPFWGGYRLRPSAIEFWQGRPDRLHDRVRYQREAGAWRIERLAP